LFNAFPDWACDAGLWVQNQALKKKFTATKSRAFESPALFALLLKVLIFGSEARSDLIVDPSDH